MSHHGSVKGKPSQTNHST